MTRLLQWLKIAFGIMVIVASLTGLFCVIYLMLTYETAPKIGPPYASYYTRCKAKGGVMIENRSWSDVCVKLERVLPDE